MWESEYSVYFSECRQQHPQPTHLVFLWLENHVPFFWSNSAIFTWYFLNRHSVIVFESVLSGCNQQKSSHRKWKEVKAKTMTLIMASQTERRIGYKAARCEILRYRENTLQRHNGPKLPTLPWFPCPFIRYTHQGHGKRDKANISN